jgi:hypothetical protein
MLGKKKPVLFSPKPEIGKTYKARSNGYEIIVRYDSPATAKNHCATCTCVDEVPAYTLISGDIGAGYQNDFQLIEEVQ